MRKFIDVTGKNEEEALRKALEQLGLTRDDVSVQILERAKSGFLGLGSCPARLRVSYGPEEEEEGLPQEQKEPVKSSEEEIPAAADEAPAEKRGSRRQRADKPRASEKRPEKKPERPERTEKKPAADKPAAFDPAQLGEEETDEKSAAIRTFLTGLLQQMDSAAEVKVYQPEKGRYKVFLEGENLGGLIGRRGETLDAIQQLTSYAVNRTGNRVRVQLDAEGYREKREQSLEHLANKVAGKVVKYRRSVTLEPMNAYERHVIHTALQDVAGVTTYSTGVDPNRRVIVAYDRDKK